MSNFAHIFITRSTAEKGDGSRIVPNVPARVLFLYDCFIESFVAQQMHKHEESLRKNDGSEYLENRLENGIELILPIKGVFVRLLGKIFGMGNEISVLALKIKPDKGTNDPRARNSDFVMHVVMYCRINFRSNAFKRFAEQCRKLAFEKKSPGIYSDLVVRIPDEVFGRVAKGAV